METIELTGRSLIGSMRGEARGETFAGLNPATGERLSPDYHSASAEETDRAIELAASAFATYSRLSGSAKAAFLRRIADEIVALTEPITARAVAETALPAARIQMEIGRTANQLRLFATLVEEGSWVDARIDRADPSRAPVPKPDVRSMLRPLGPVAVFGASNFPLAFSVAGGDTASALAAGCPVVVKAHPAHPGTSELVGLAIAKAARDLELPEGVFSLIFDAGYERAVQIVKHPLIKAAGFTGSRAGGRALIEAASARAEPIPFYAEMSSINPVFILPGALRERGEQIAAGLHSSVTLGAGQFCTNPGLLLMMNDEAAGEFTERLASLISASPGFTLLTPGIAKAYRSGIAAHKGRATALAEGTAGGGDENATSTEAQAALFHTEAARFLSDPSLSEEVFGPATLIVRAGRRDELLEVARNLEGQLTATVHGTEEDLREYGDLIAILETKAGRLIWNAYPTGVEVCHAMVHGGPWPATSDLRTTSVGTRAIVRFARPVCYQGMPDLALPDELKDSNPLKIWRLIDGELTKGSVGDNR